MNISKKLVLMATVGLGMQFGAFAKFDASQVKTEVTTILNFISTLRLHANNDSEETVRNNSAEIVQWLETKLEDTDWNTALDNFHVIALANVIQNAIQKDASIDTTIDEIQNIINNKKTEDTRQAQEYRKKTILTMGALAAFYAGLFCFGIYLGPIKST
jgi:hypothetical protein